MSEQSKRTEIGSIGEFGLIDRLRQRADLGVSVSTVLGIGDDAAVLRVGEREEEVLLTTSEIFTEGIHFELAYHPLRHLGYKIVVAAISDIIAMNGRPSHLSVCLALSNRFSVEAVEEMYDGILHACEVYHVDLIGGDTVSSKSGLSIAVQALGRAQARRVCYRHTASPGDLLCVTGDLGAAYLGLQILEREKQLYLHDPSIQPDLDDAEYLVGRQLKPEARLDMLHHFDNSNFQPTALIDISDGLSSDLFQLCKASHCGVLLEENKIPIREAAKLKALDFQLDPYTCALNGGEDFELLFTASLEDLEKVRHLPDTSIIGEMTAPEEGVLLESQSGRRHALTAPGWPKSPLDRT